MIDNQKIIRPRKASRNLKIQDIVGRFSKDTKNDKPSHTTPHQQNIIHLQPGNAEENRGGLRLKFKRGPNAKKYEVAGSVYQNEFLGVSRKGQRIDANATMDVKELLRLGKATHQLQQEECDFKVPENLVMEEYQDIEQDVKVPNFLIRTSLEQSREKNQFYMTQVIHQQQQQQRQADSRQSLNLGKAANRNSYGRINTVLPQHSKIHEKQATSLNKSQVMKSKTKQISPHHTAHYHVKFNDTNAILDKYMNLYDLPVKHGQVKTRDQKKPQAFNSSTLLMNMNRGDLLNSNAPLNLTQVHMYDRESVKAGFSEAVNSSSNFHRVNSKESNPVPQNASSYYNATDLPQSASPTKDLRRKKEPLRNTQDLARGKDFLNPALQQLIQQQRTQKPADKRGHKKRLNKTLENFKDNYYANMGSETQKIEAIFNNYLGSQNSYMASKQGSQPQRS